MELGVPLTLALALALTLTLTLALTLPLTLARTLTLTLALTLTLTLALTPTLSLTRYAQGAVSQYLHALEPGAMVSFKHIIFNVKRQYPFAPAKTISLIAAGTGIAPIYQALLRLMSEPGDDRQVVLLYGNRSPKDILLKDELDAMAIKAAGRRKIRVRVRGRIGRPAQDEGYG